jgi:hypothetical protein
MLIVGCSAGADDSSAPASNGDTNTSTTGTAGSGGSAESSGAAGSSSVSNGGSPVSGGGSGGSPAGAGGGSSGSGGTTGKGGAGGGSAGGPNLGDGGPVGSKCDNPVGAGLPAGAPKLTPGTWKDISPAGVDWSHVFTQGLAVDPCNPAVLYLTTDSFDANLGGLHKSLDGGATWTRVAKTTSGPGYIDEPIRVQIDPKNTQHLYIGDGVRGGTEGFWISTDGGNTFTQPAGFANLKSQLFPFDVYDVAVDPTDFNHILVSHHGAWGWTDTKWNTNSGVLESKDGGMTWIVHEPMSGWGTGHAITFLYNPALGLGDSKTWLLGTQGAGQWRTTDAGTTWKKVSENGIQHGGGKTYYTKAGVLYATGGNQNMRSTDNGATWTSIGPGGGYNGIVGDGKNLYTAKCFGPTAILMSPETDGLTWTDSSSQQFNQGPFEMAYDAVNGIVYNAGWGAGMWALKVGP